MARPSKRPNRIPVSGKRDILTVEGKDPNYKYTWVNDTNGMVQRFQQGGYEVVEHEVIVGQNQADHSNPTSKAVSMNVGQGVTAYLMRIPKEWHDEDMKDKHNRIDRSEADLKRTLNSGKDGTYGKVTID